jgi:TPR repeat protein
MRIVSAAMAVPRLVIALLLGGLLFGAPPCAADPPAPASLQHRAEAGDAAAQFELALQLGRGEGAEPDPLAAVGWLARAAAGGHAEAQWMLGSLLLRDADDAEQREAALAWLQRAADQGRVEALVELGVHLHDSGDGAAALEQFRRAAASGEAALQFNLGLMLRDGELGAPDPAEALRWFRAAAVQGHAEAQAALGTMYAQAQGTSRHLGAAYFWLLLAATGSSGAEPARDALAARVDAAERAAIAELAGRWTPGLPGLPHAAGTLQYTRFDYDDIDAEGRARSSREHWTILDAVARRRPAPAGRGEEMQVELLLSPVPIDHALLATHGAEGTGLATHLGVMIRIDAAGRPVQGLLHDAGGYVELAFDAPASDLVVRDGVLVGSLALAPAHGLGVAPALSIDVQVAAPMQPDGR